MPATRYRIRHLTRYRYAEDVASAHHLLHLGFRPHGRQTVHVQSLVITPQPSWQSRFVDAFGNPCHAISVEGVHRSLDILSENEVTASSPHPFDPAGTPAWEVIRDRLADPADPKARAASEFALPSPVLATLAPYAELARDATGPRRPIAEVVQALAHLIHTRFTFDSTATTVATPPETALLRRRGVCQDFAHIMLGALRHLGLAGRYVSGYLRTRPPPGQPRLIGADASHAWVSVWCGGDLWIEIDPTNDRLVDRDHITLAWGRDYQDVSPVRGVIMGGGSHSVTVSVDVELAAPSA